MINVMEEVERRLSVLAGLDVTGVNHAADMLTLQFGPLKEVATRRGTSKRVGAWALHIQCKWTIERGGEVLATQDDLCRSDDDATRAIEKLNRLLVEPDPAIVERIAVGPSANLRISLSRNTAIVITPSGVVGDEDWRLFAPGSDEPHFVVEGGVIDPDSLT